MWPAWASRRSWQVRAGWAWRHATDYQVAKGAQVPGWRHPKDCQVARGCSGLPQGIKRRQAMRRRAAVPAAACTFTGVPAAFAYLPSPCTCCRAEQQACCRACEHDHAKADRGPEGRGRRHPLQACPIERCTAACTCPRLALSAGAAGVLLSACSTALPLTPVRAHQTPTPPHPTPPCSLRTLWAARWTFWRS